MIPIVKSIASTVASPSAKDIKVLTNFNETTLSDNRVEHENTLRENAQTYEQEVLTPS